MYTTKCACDIPRPRLRRGIVTEKERALAVCQMSVLETIMSCGGMSVEQTLRELGLNRPELEALARQENLHWIADKIADAGAMA